MGTSDKKTFLRLKQAVLNAKLKSSNLLVFSFVGTGSSHYLKELARADTSLTYINSKDQSLGAFSLLDLDLVSAIKLIKSTNVNQKCVLLIKNGSDQNMPELKDIISHFYLKFYLGVSSQDEIKDMVKRFSPNTTTKTVNRIILESNCIPKLAKQLLINPDEDADLVVNEILFSLTGYSPQDLIKFGLIDEEHNFYSPLFKKKSNNIIDIKINFDLSFTENGGLASQKLVSSEALILKKIIENKGHISKEEVSNIKWGEGKYDEYSDQAINKALRRLDQKLIFYKLVTIPKIGFKLQVK